MISIIIKRALAQSVNLLIHTNRPSEKDFAAVIVALSAAISEASGTHTKLVPQEVK